MMSVRFFLVTILLVALPGTLISCKKKQEKAQLGLNSESFYQQYNEFIVEWLEQEKQEAEEAIAEKEQALAEATDSEEKKRIENGIAELERTKAKMEFRQSLGDFFAYKEESELPDNLVWENGMDEPEIGDPAAKKGGLFRYFWTSFPPTVRQFGSVSNNSSRGDLYDLLEVYLVHFHPVTQNIIPGIAQEWAVSEDGRTTYFRLHPEAKFNDGHPIEAEDFLTFSRLRLADQVDSIFFKQFIREQYAQFTVYGPRLLGVTLPEAKPRRWMPYNCGDFAPAATHFYTDFGPDFEERYQWVVPPTTAAYKMLPEDLIKGQSVALTRVDDWWLKDKKFYRYRYNADKIHYRVIRDLPKAWEVFRAGGLDYFPITLPEYYYDRSEMDAVFNGYIQRATWYNQYPRIPWGLYFNTAEAPLDRKLVRRGLAYATNWDRVIDDVFRGDSSRLAGFTTGFGDITNPNVQARPFSIQKARAAFAEAGYTKENKEGILVNEEGEPMEISLTYTLTPERSKMMVILKEEAKKAGVNYILDGRDGIAAYKKTISKEHQAYFSAWGFIPPSPHYYEYFHSRNAYDEKGNRKTQTNNVFSYADDKMDRLTESYRNSRTMEELISNAHEIQEIIAEEDLFVPGYAGEFSRIAYWRWLEWPDVPETRLSPPLAYIPMESYCYWIDEAKKEETLDAKINGKKFPEVELVSDAYRTSPSKRESETIEPETNKEEAEIE